MPRNRRTAFVLSQFLSRIKSVGAHFMLSRLSARCMRFVSFVCVFFTVELRMWFEFEQLGTTTQHDDDRHHHHSHFTRLSLSFYSLCSGVNNRAQHLRCCCCCFYTSPHLLAWLGLRHSGHVSVVWSRDAVARALRMVASLLPHKTGSTSARA